MSETDAYKISKGADRWGRRWPPAGQAETVAPEAAALEQALRDC